MWLRFVDFLIGARWNFLGNFFLRWTRGLLRKSRCICFARFNIPEYRTNRIRFLQLRGDLADLTFARCRYTHHRFVCLDVDDFLVGHDFVARLHFDIDNRRFGDRLAELGHDDWNLRHKFIPSAARALSWRSASRPADARSKDPDDTGSACLSRSRGPVQHRVDEILRSSRARSLPRWRRPTGKIRRPQANGRSVRPMPAPGRCRAVSLCEDRQLQSRNSRVPILPAPPA